VVVALDQATKLLALRTLAPGESRPVIDGVLHWTLHRNPGAAFGLLPGFPVVFTILAAVIAGVIVATAWRPRPLASTVALGLVLGGAIGNLIDRLVRDPGPFRGHVVDFVDLRIWPAFNVADAAVVCGAILLALTGLSGPPARPEPVPLDLSGSNGSPGDEPGR
jgi:signal peptidase II